MKYKNNVLLMIIFTIAYYLCSYVPVFCMINPTHKYPINTKLGWVQSTITKGSWGDNLTTWGKSLGIDITIDNMFARLPYVKLSLTSSTPYHNGFIITNTLQDIVKDNQFVDLKEQQAIDSANINKNVHIDIQTDNDIQHVQWENMHSHTISTRLFGAFFNFEHTALLSIGLNLFNPIYLQNKTTFMMLKLSTTLKHESITSGYVVSLGAAQLKLQTLQGNIIDSYNTKTDTTIKQTQDSDTMQATYSTGYMNNMFIKIARNFIGINTLWQIVSQDAMHILNFYAEIPIESQILCAYKPDTALHQYFSRCIMQYMTDIVKYSIGSTYEFSVIYNKYILMSISFMIRKTFTNPPSPIPQHMKENLNLDVSVDDFMNINHYMAKYGYLVYPTLQIGCYLNIIITW